MKKVQMQSANGVSINIEKIAALFPNCVTETKDDKGNLCKKVDFEKLQEELSDDIIGTGKERYQFTWPDKRQAIHTANTPTNKTLRPCREESVDFDNTQNLYIEGDNLDVLKLLRENYLGKIKMIYIDPPYNTGNDFVYNDNFKMDEDLFSEASGERDEDGNRMVVNSENNGRYHTDWLNMMYPRLKVAKDLLSEDGVIFISIGQEECHDLTLICNEIFGERNIEGIISRQMKSGGNQGKSFSKNIDYILVYAKNTNSLLPFRENLEDELKDKVYNKVEKNGLRKGERYRLMGLYQAGLNEWRPNQKYFITCPDGEIVLPPCTIQDEVMREGDGRWRWSKPRFEEELEKGNIEFVETKSSPLVTNNGDKSHWNVYTKIWLSDREEEGRIPTDLITGFENRHSSIELKRMEIPFDFAKPVGLITKLIGFLQKNEDITVLDFFSGSATTAHSIMHMNATDGKYKKFVLVQIPEKTESTSAIFKAGYPTICEIGKERIRRAAKKIKEEMEAEGKDTSKMDFGFRVLKLDSSNMKDVYYKPQDTNANLFSEENVKEDRTAEDLLFQVMPKCDLMLSEKIVKENIKGKDVYFVKDNYLAACFDKDLTDDVIKEIAQRKPFHFVMREGGAKTDSVLDNFEQIFKTYSAGTKCMVI